jgi:hypothetical protein
MPKAVPGADGDAPAPGTTHVREVIFELYRRQAERAARKLMKPCLGSLMCGAILPAESRGR